MTRPRRRPSRRAILTPLLILVLIAAIVPPRAALADLTQSFPIGVSQCAMDATPQLCDPVPIVHVFTTGGLQASFVASSAHCSSIKIHLLVDGIKKHVTGALAPGAGSGTVNLGPVEDGLRQVGVQAEGVPGGCNAGSLASWSGTLTVTVSGVSAADVKIAALNQSTVGVSTLVSQPNPPPIVPAGLDATYTRVGATGLVTLAAATYDTNPLTPTDPCSGCPATPSPPPILPVGFVDLLLLGAAETDTVLAHFVPPNPVVPSNAVTPQPPPIVPPNPVRLVYFDVKSTTWEPVLGSGGAAVLASSDNNRFTFTVTFSNTSTPKVTQLTGTVFATVPSYGFVGFQQPVDNNRALNVAKAGRAIPLKWRLYDLGNNPVTNLNPAVVKITSVAVNCSSGSVVSDAIQESEYATGASGLQNHGSGAYQFNWATPASYAGTCRQLRLDLGERKPDGTPFYREADFQFTP